LAGEDEKAVPTGEVTRLLGSWKKGESEALEELLPLVYQELRLLASRYLRKERQDHTLQPTALVNEAYVRLLGKPPGDWKDRSHFFAVAAQAMRNILVDHARRQLAGKRIGPNDKVALENVPELSSAPTTDVLALHEALDKLAEINPRQAKLVELRYFGGLTNVEAAEALDASRATVERDWQVARLWLRRELTRG
jgi:RNA polymerase sigma-70 factor (ECF subfamily)